MTGAEHYAEAERLLRAYVDVRGEILAGRIAGRVEAAEPAATLAQVHATLALAAATACYSPADQKAWRETASITGGES